MEKDWAVVYTSQSPFEAEVIHGMLMEHGIENVILNQRDSAYTVFGNVSIYVHKKNFTRAEKLVNDPEA